MGGDNSKENIIWLYPSEHFIAHKLLYLENLDNKKLALAWTTMAYFKSPTQKRDYEITPDEYELARIVASKAMSGENNPMYKHIYTKEELDKLKQPKSEEFKQKLRDYYKLHKKVGMNWTYEDKLKISNGVKKYYSTISLEEDKNRRLKISQALKDKPKPSGFGEHLSEIRKGENNPMYGLIRNAKKVKCIETGEIFESAKQACEKMGFDKCRERGIRRYCNGQIKKPQCGYTWEFVDE